MTVGSYEAKTRLPELLRRVEEGERITITRHGRPIAMLVSPSGLPETTPAQVVEELLAFGFHRPLGPDLTVRDLVEEGRR